MVWRAALKREPRSFTAGARERSRCLRLHRDAFLVGLAADLHELLPPWTVAGEEAGRAVDVADGGTLAMAVDELDGIGVVCVDPER